MPNSPPGSKSNKMRKAPRSKSCRAISEFILSFFFLFQISSFLLFSAQNRESSFCNLTPIWANQRLECRPRCSFDENKPAEITQNYSFRGVIILFNFGFAVFVALWDTVSKGFPWQGAGDSYSALWWSPASSKRPFLELNFQRTIHRPVHYLLV